MCFNEQVSWINLILGWTICSALYLTAYNNEEKVIAIFFAFTILMQLWEALLWRTLGTNCSNINTVYSIAAMISNHLQPILFLALCLIFLPYPSPARNYLLTATYVIMAVYILIIIPYSYVYLKMEDKCTYTTKHGSLYWKWNNLEVFSDSIDVYYRFICYAVFLLLMTLIALTFFNEYRILLASLIFLTFMASAYIYDGRKVVGSMWCFFALIAPLIILFVRKH